jgi:tetratricopeptide (TPR) repeat protein
MIMKFRLLTAVWGTEFCDLFVRLAARSLLASGNFPDLSHRHPTVYSILTTEQDAVQIRSSPVFAALAEAGQVELQAIEPHEIDPGNPSSHWIIWRKGIEAAKANGEFVIYVMPDIVYASGTLLDWAKAFEQGYRAIFTSIPEVVLETTQRELETTFPAESQLPLSLGVPELNKLCLKHLHPYHLCMLRDGRRWVPHPETVGYVVGGTAFVQRVIGSHPICFDPGFFEFNHAYVPKNRFDKIAVLPGSAISLEPFLKFMSLYYRPSRMVGDRLSNFGWWFDYFTGRSNDVESARSYVFALPGPVSSVAVAQAHARGSFYRAQCLAARAIFRISTKLVELGCDRAAEILATAHYAGRLRRYKLLSTPMTVLVPNNEALARAGFNLAGMSNVERRRRLLQLVHGHCFTGNRQLKIGQPIVTTSRGAIRVTTEAESKHPKAAGTIVSGPFELDGITIYLTNFVAKPDQLLAGRDRTTATDARHRGGTATFRSGRELILIHPSLDSKNERDGVPTFRHEHHDNETHTDCTALAEALRRLVQDSMAKQPEPNGGEEQVADHLQAHVRSSSLVGLRGRIRAKLCSLWKVARRSPENALKEHIRELVLANRLQEADSLVAESTQVWRELAGEFAAQGKVELALYCRRRAAESCPDNLQVRVEWVRDLLVAGQLKDAKSAGAGLTQLWRILGGGFHSEGRQELMLYCRRSAVDSDPADLQVRQELLRDLLIAGRFEEANSADAGLLQPWRILGSGFISEGQLELGLHCRRRAADLDPSDMQSRKDLVRDLILADRFQDAATAADGLKQLWRELAGEFAAQGQPELQRCCLNQAAATGSPTRGRGVAERLFRDIQIEIGLVALRDLLKCYSDQLDDSLIDEVNGSPGPLKYLDQFLAGSQTRLDPLNRLARLLERDPDFAEAWIEKALIHHEAGQIVQAVEAALHALRARPRCLRAGHNPHPRAEAAGLVASCLEMAGVFEDAITAYRTCLSIDEAQPLVRVRLGQLMWKQGLIDEAMREFMKGMASHVQMANLPDLPRRLEKLSLG